MKTIININGVESYYASEQLVNELTALNTDGVVINLAYTDYGGSILDKLLISYLLEEGSKDIIVEQTPWNGQNAFVFGETAEELEACITPGYVFDFDNLTEYFFDKKNEAINEVINRLQIDEYKRELAYEYLSENSSLETFGLDFCESKLFDFIESNNN